jgi:hypothetical protein
MNRLLALKAVTNSNHLEAAIKNVKQSLKNKLIPATVPTPRTVERRNEQYTKKIVVALS